MFAIACYIPQFMSDLIESKQSTEKFNDKFWLLKSNLKTSFQEI